MKIKIKDDVKGFLATLIGKEFNVRREEEHVYTIDYVVYLSDDVNKEFPINTINCIHKDKCEIVDNSPIVKPVIEETPMWLK